MSETGSIERKRIEAFLSSPQFVRLCEVFETYQRVLQESKKDIEQQEIIKERMNEIFGEREDVVKDAVENEDPEALGYRSRLVQATGSSFMKKCKVRLSNYYFSQGLLPVPIEDQQDS